MAVVIERRLVYRSPSYAMGLWLSVCFLLGGLACVFIARPISSGQRLQTRTVLAQGVSAVSDAETRVESGYATMRMRLLHWDDAPLYLTLTLFQGGGSIATVETTTLTQSELERDGGWITVSARVKHDVSRALVTISRARSSSPSR